MSWVKTISKHGLSITVIAVLFGTLAFLYQQSVRVNTVRLYQVEALVDELLFQDSQLEGDMALLLAGRLAHFDTLVKGMDNLDAIRDQMDVMVGGVPELSPSLDALHAALEAQKEPMEKFKTHFSTYLNSIRYLPKLLEEIQHEYPQYNHVLTHVYHDFLRVITHGDEFNDTKIKELIKQMHEPELKPVVQHLQFLLEQYKTVEDALYAFFHCGIDETATVLGEKYQLWFNKTLAKSDLYRVILFGFSLFLLVCVVVVLWRLRRSNDALKKSHSFLHFLQKSLDEHAEVTITNAAGIITFVNDKFCVTSGYSRGEVVGKNHRMLKTTGHTLMFFKRLWATISSGDTWHGVIENKSKNGSSYWADTSITPFLDDNGKPWQYITIRTDVTQQVAAERSLHESYERYRTLSELTPFSLGIVQKGAWVYVNPAALELFASPSEKALLGLSVYDVVPQAYQESFMQTLKTSCDKQQPIPLQEVCLQTIAGDSFDVELQGAPLHWNGERAILLVMHDVSERKQAEEERLLYQERLEHKQRLESLGVLAGGIAHDFNNILTSIMGNTAIASSNLEPSSALQPYLQKVGKASERAAELCQQLLMYSGGGKLEKTHVLLTDLLGDVVDIIQTTLPSAVNLVADVEAGLPLVEADVRQLQQVILNLLTNAKDAVGDSGVITAKLGVMHVDETCKWVSRSNIDAGDYVYFEVVDSGCGMDQATQDKMFEPFFTTKKTGRGLGMSAILGIVESHHGAIAVKSTQRQGTSIRVVLPVAVGAVLQAEVVQESVQYTQVSGKVLVIDDEPGILELLVMILDDIGFEVVTAEDGEAGVAQFENHKDDLVLVICDMVMPKMNGAEVANYIGQRAKDIPILLSSGYDKDTLSHIEADIVGVIQKPYHPDTLIKTVMQTLHMQ